MSQLNPKPIKIGGKSVKLFGSANSDFTDKFNRIKCIAVRFNEIEKQLRKNLSSDDKELFERSLATLMLMKTGIRLGNEESANGYVSKMKGSEGKVLFTYGLTTLKPNHVVKQDGDVKLVFNGKKNVNISLNIEDHEIGRNLLKLKEMKKDYLFSFNEYEIRKFVYLVVGKKVNIKDFRTLHANVSAYHCALEIMKTSSPKSKSERNEELNDIFRHVASHLGNTYEVVRRSYIDPQFISWYKQEREI